MGRYDELRSRRQRRICLKCRKRFFSYNGEHLCRRCNVRNLAEYQPVRGVVSDRGLLKDVESQ